MVVLCKLHHTVPADHVSLNQLDYVSHIQWNHLHYQSQISFCLHIWLYSVLLHYIIIPGEHVSYKHLDYMPGRYSAITSLTNSHVMVAKWTLPAAVHIHQMPSGETVRSITLQELGLRETDFLPGVNFSGLLNLAIGNGISTKSIHTYKVQYVVSMCIICFKGG